jgi:hypothetical protein
MDTKLLIYTLRSYPGAMDDPELAVEIIVRCLTNDGPYGSTDLEGVEERIITTIFDNVRLEVDYIRDRFLEALAFAEEQESLEPMRQLARDPHLWSP